MHLKVRQLSKVSALCSCCSWPCRYIWICLSASSCCLLRYLLVFIWWSKFAFKVKIFDLIPQQCYRMDWVVRIGLLLLLMILLFVVFKVSNVLRSMGSVALISLYAATIWCYCIWIVIAIRFLSRCIQNIVVFFFALEWLRIGCCWLLLLIAFGKLAVVYVMS